MAADKLITIVPPSVPTGWARRIEIRENRKKFKSAVQRKDKRKDSKRWKKERKKKGEGKEQRGSDS